MRKVLVIAISVCLFAATSFPAQAAERPTSVASCKKSTAKPRVPATLKQPMTPAKKIPATLTLNTNCGPIRATLLTKRAPQTTTNIAFLANSKYYDGTICHRLTTGGLFVLQCGDPTGTGSGGPNFSYRDENLPQAVEANYPAGVVAMANSGANTNGSQFFIVYEDTSLPPSYTIWGKVTKGLDIVQAIAKEGVIDGKSDGLPKRAIAIEKVKVR